MFKGKRRTSESSSLKGESRINASGSQITSNSLTIQYCCEVWGITALLVLSRKVKIFRESKEAEMISIEFCQFG